MIENIIVINKSVSIKDAGILLFSFESLILCRVHVQHLSIGIIARFMDVRIRNIVLGMAVRFASRMAMQRDGEPVQSGNMISFGTGSVLGKVRGLGKYVVKRWIPSEINVRRMSDKYIMPYVAWNKVSSFTRFRSRV